jgi:hypothetical protein
MMQRHDAEHQVVLAGPACRQQLRLLVGDVRPRALRAGDLDHRQREVNRVDVRESLGQLDGMVPGTTAEVQRLPAGGWEHAHQPVCEVVILAEVGPAVVVGGGAIERLSCQPGGRTASHESAL